MLREQTIDELRGAWQTQPTTLLRISPRQMEQRARQVDVRQQRITRAVTAAFVGDVIAFTTFLFFFPDPFQRAGSLWIMIAMGHLVLRLRARRRRASDAQRELATRPSIDGFRDTLDQQLDFYRALLAIGLVLPGVLLFIYGGVRAEPASLGWGVVALLIMVAGVANGLRVHVPRARSLHTQLRELDTL